MKCTEMHFPISMHHSLQTTCWDFNGSILSDQIMYGGVSTVIKSDNFWKIFLELDGKSFHYPMDIFKLKNSYSILGQHWNLEKFYRKKWERKWENKANLSNSVVREILRSRFKFSLPESYLTSLTHYILEAFLQVMEKNDGFSYRTLKCKKGTYMFCGYAKGSNMYSEWAICIWKRAIYILSNWYFGGLIVSFSSSIISTITMNKFCCNLHLSNKMSFAIFH